MLYQSINALRASQFRVVNMEIQGASCEEVNIDLKELLELNVVKDLTRGNLMEKLHKSFTPEKWTELKAKLKESLTPFQLARALKILRPLHVDSTEEDLLNNSVNIPIK